MSAALVAGHTRCRWCKKVLELPDGVWFCSPECEANAKEQREIADLYEIIYSTKMRTDGNMRWYNRPGEGKGFVCQVCTRASEVPIKVCSVNCTQLKHKDKRRGIR